MNMEHIYLSLNFKLMKKPIYIIVFLLLIFVLAGCSLVRFLNYKITEPELIFREPNGEEVIRRKIDGAPIENEAATNLYPIAIMVENAIDAWPLSGLDKANIVIEAITEASTPRFVAIYANNETIEKIGPVRSARPYYLDWIEPFESVYMHVGGSPEALRKIRSDSYDLIDLDQFFNYKYYWRDNKWRYAPHNVFTSSGLIKQALEDENLKEPADYEMWQYKKDKDLENRPDKVNDITLLYTNNYYKVDWQYNKEENNYIRHQAGNIMKLSDGEWVKAKNIIVQVNDMYVLDQVGRKRITTIGDGNAWIFRDGEAIEGKWIKKSKDERIKYFDKDDNEIEFNGGTTWIEVIPDEDYLRY